VSAHPPVRVAHVVETLDLGGLEKLLIDFVRYTDRTRFVPQVVTLGARGTLADEIEALDCPVISLGLGGGLRARSGAWSKLSALFRRERIGVVHTHSEGPLLYGAPAAKREGVPCVVHTRHHGPDLGRSGRALFAMSVASRWVDTYACVADDGARCCVTEGINASKVVTIWNGIDLDRFAYQGPAPRGPAVIVARLNPEKDHATLLHAVALAIVEEPEFRLEIAGDGPCLAELQSLARHLKLEDHARFLGKVDDVPALLSRAGLVVLSSKLEGISLTLLEAMARGLPVVATKVGGNPEVVIDGETGRLVPAETPEVLAAAMLELWRDPRKSREFGIAGRIRAERFFDVRKTLARYEAIYEHGCLKRNAAATRVEAGVLLP